MTSDKGWKDYIGTAAVLIAGAMALLGSIFGGDIHAFLFERVELTGTIGPQMRVLDWNTNSDANIKIKLRAATPP